MMSHAQSSTGQRRTLRVELPRGSEKGKAFDFVFHGLEQVGGSYEVRVYADNSSADQTTPKTEEAGYLGSFHIYGYGYDRSGREDKKPSDSGARLPMDKRLIVPSERFRRVHGDARKPLTLTLVPVVEDDRRASSPEPFFVESAEVKIRDE